MPWIKTIEPQQASGLLKRLYDEAKQRSGKVFNVLRIQSLRPRVLRSSTKLYIDVMFQSEGGLSRAQREMIATVVSRANNCHY